MDIEQIITIYTKALTNEAWLGAWAPVRAELLWQDPETDTALFRLIQDDLEEDDEYEFYEAGTLVLARRAPEAEDFHIYAGLAPQAVDSSSVPE